VSIPGYARKRVERLLREGWTQRSIARAAGVSRGTVVKIAKENPPNVGEERKSG